MGPVKICGVCGSRNYYTRERCGYCGSPLDKSGSGFLDSLFGASSTTKLLYLVLFLLLVIVITVVVWQFWPQTETTELVVSNVFVDLKTSSGARISWATNKPASSQVEYGKTSVYNMVSPLYPLNDVTINANAGVTQHSVIMTGLQKNTFYHFRVKSVDVDGNISYSSPDMTFRTADRLDFAGPD
jgi:hypothetical protein